MRLSETHAAIEAGQLLSEDQAFVTLVAIEHLARIEGIPVSGLDFSAPLFGIRHPYHRKDLRGSWAGRAQYLSWRNLILNAQMLSAPGDTDADPWLSLGRAERLYMEKRSATLYSLRNFLATETRPRDLTNTILIETFCKLPVERQNQFRAGVNSFRRLFKNDIALQTGLLPPTCPDRLPRNSELMAPPMSLEIAALKSTGNVLNANTAINYVNRLAVTGGLLNGTTDTLDDLRRALPRLPLPADVGLEDMDPKLLNAYLSKVRRVAGGRDFRLAVVGQAWADLRAAARAEGCDTSLLWALGKPATARNLFPWDISETAALAIIASYSHSSMWSQCRRGCEQFDALRGKVPSDFLPPVPIGIRRPLPRPPRKPKPIVLLNPAEMAWGVLYVRLREKGWNSQRVAALSYLRVRATAAGHAPHELTQSFIETLRCDITKRNDYTRFRVAVREIETLSKDPAFNDLPSISAPRDRRFTHGGSDRQPRAELEDLLDFMNAAPSTRRGFRVAVGVFTDALKRPNISLEELFHVDMTAYNLGAHEARRKVHSDKIKNLRDFADLPWTSAWRDLQRETIASGMTAKANPVPKILSWNPETDPDGLTKEWAQRLDRELRSTLTNPPHGRADLALTLARHLKAFDALHDIPQVAGSGLLPPRIGEIR